jgi:hypothetical protein
MPFRTRTLLTAGAILAAGAGNRVDRPHARRIRSSLTRVQWVIFGLTSRTG